MILVSKFACLCNVTAHKKMLMQDRGYSFHPIFLLKIFLINYPYMKKEELCK